MTSPIALVRPASLPALMGVISDLDGVVYRGDAPIPEAVAAFQHWHKIGVPYCFVTNNSTKSEAEFAATLTAMGVVTDPSQVVTTAGATALFLAARFPAGTKVFVMGSVALTEAIAGAGFVIADSDAEVVVMGLDRQATYARLKIALELVMAGATLIGTNPDLLLPTETGFDPGAGSLLTAIAASSGKVPLIVGKPQPFMIETALARLGTPAEGTIMIGDQIETDIESGQAAGLFSVLVQTGVPVRAAQKATPDLTVATLSALY